MISSGVLMGTGAYYPEVSGAGLQCRELIRTLRDRVSFTVMTTTADTLLSKVGEVDGTPVYRVLVDVDQIKSKLVAALENALRSLLKDPTFAQELGGKARETVEERYSITQTASRMLEAYESLAGQPGSRR